mgnify:CR=1 FL=1
MNATQLRANLFLVLRRVLATGKPEDVEWKGQHLQIVPKESLSSMAKLARLRPHPGVIQGDPETIVHLDWSSEWQAEDVDRLS